MFKFQKLEVWKKAIVYADDMIVLAGSLPREYRYSISDQLVRASLSIPNNIAEGSGRRSQAEAKNFFNIAKGSTYETITILVILEKRKYILLAKFDEYYQIADEICRMLTGLIQRDAHE